PRLQKTSRALPGTDQGLPRTIQLRNAPRRRRECSSVRQAALVSLPLQRHSRYVPSVASRDLTPPGRSTINQKSYCPHECRSTFFDSVPRRCAEASACRETGPPAEGKLAARAHHAPCPS